MQKIQGNQQKHGGCRPPVGKQAAGEDPDNHEQKDSGKHSRNAPAKGIHAKTGNSQADKKLAQRRVGVFIGAESVKILVGGSGKDGFIKYGSG